MRLHPALLTAALLAGPAHADDGFSLGLGANYSSGDYGTDTTTDILSVPVTARLDRNRWTLRASLPWLRVSGDPNVLPGLGPVDNDNPFGRGRSGLPLLSPDPANGEPRAEKGTASGIGDLNLTATYAVPTRSATGVDLSVNAKIATADENNGLGTGANDYGVAIDLYRDFGGTLLFGGAGYTALGDSDYIDVDAVASGNLGLGWKAGAGRLGLVYDYREASSRSYEARQEVSAFLSQPAGANGKLQLLVGRGLSDGSPEWSVGVNLQHAF